MKNSNDSKSSGVSMQAFDLIGDIHGYADELRALLGRLGYEQRAGVYRHPDRMVIFLGDFVDRGPQIAEGLAIARSMVEAGTALAVMGNHELNALAFHTPDPESPGEYLRRHTPKNVRQHAATLDQLSLGDLASHLAWFRTLPLWLEFDGLRVVHACWDAESVAAVGRGNVAAEEGFVLAACREGGGLFRPVETLTKGKEAALPANVYQLDSDGQPRNHFRLRWYTDPRSQTYRSYGLMNEPVACDDLLPAGVVAGAAPYPGPSLAPPVFIGHYGLRSRSPALLAANVACVDWGVASGGFLCAYRWDGERELSPAKFVHTK
jgi:hypothetical protein